MIKVPIFFANSSEFRKWLEKNHAKEKELLVGYYKVSTGKPSMTWSESVDQALCFGWIDSVRRTIDEQSYSIRFTPRKPTSIWSAINIAKVKELTQKGLMLPVGLSLYENRKEDKTGIYSYENKPAKLPYDLEKIFKSNKKAWKFFSTQSHTYKKNMLYWILSAKQQATQLSRLEKVIRGSEDGKRLR